jgi:segregation and condensation protein B
MTAPTTGETDADNAGPDMSPKDEALEAAPGEDGAEETFEVARRHKRVIEALLFASAEPLAVDAIREFLGGEAPVEDLLAELQADYAERGVNLVVRDGAYALRTAEDLRYILKREETERRPMGRAALETLAVVAYHQPVTRAEIEDIRGVSMSKGTLDILLEAGFVRMRGRRRTVGRPVTYGTTLEFLDHFGLEQLRDLPGLDELKGAGFLSAQVPPDLQIPFPFDGELHPDEDPLDPDDAGEEDDADDIPDGEDEA